jgi:hypothetical protein
MGKKIHGKSNTKLYKSWYDMIRRCTDKNNRKYNIYGGRGISICNEWRNNFEEFEN